MKLSCVMIVDDSEEDQFISKHTIGEYYPGITIMQAYDGQEALEMLDVAEQQPQIIFLDINMPRMDGHTFLKVYDKKEDKTASVVIMLTSSDQQEDVERSTAYKCVINYFTKTLDVENLATLSEISL